MKLAITAFPVVALALVSCTSPRSMERWELPEGKIAFKPICASHRAHSLGSEVAPSGLVPSVSFSINWADAPEIRGVTVALLNNGFRPAADGYFSVNGHWILFAEGNGTLKTQHMADRLYVALCDLETEHVQLIHMRYNKPSDLRRVL